MTFPPTLSGSTALVARSVVAAAHAGRLVRSGPGRPDDAAAVSVVDDGGEPWVLTPPWERPRPGPARLRIVTSGPGASAVVLLAGRLEARVVATPDNLPGALLDALGRHRSLVSPPATSTSCFDLQTWPALAVSRLAVASIGVAMPAARGAAPRALEPVPLADYAACEPDLWRIQQAAVLAQLNERHPDAMLVLARTAGAVDAGIAAAHAVDADGLTLATIGPDGAGYVRLPFPERLESPSEVGSALFG
jgi:hypothetical protein